jgi:hypothetical protein
VSVRDDAAGAVYQLTAFGWPVEQTTTRVDGGLRLRQQAAAWRAEVWLRPIAGNILSHKAQTAWGCAWGSGSCWGLLFLGFVAVFAQTNELTSGVVEHVDRRDGYCEKGRVPCTIFDARVSYAVDGQAYRATENRWARGHGVPVEEAPLPPGSSAWVMFNGATPGSGVVVSLRWLYFTAFSVLGAPLMLLARFRRER